MEKTELWKIIRICANIVETVEKGLADKARVLAQSHVIKFYRHMEKRETWLNLICKFQCLSIIAWRPLLPLETKT